MKLNQEKLVDMFKLFINKSALQNSAMPDNISDASEKTL